MRDGGSCTTPERLNLIFVNTGKITHFMLIQKH